MSVEADPPRTEADSSQDVRSRPSRRPRTFLPRFGLQTLLIFAILFCLASAWVGRNAHRMRQEETAIETLERAGARIELDIDPEFHDRASDAHVRYDDAVGRLIGWKAGPMVRSVELFGFDPGDPELIAAMNSLRYFPETRSLALSGPGIHDESLLHVQDLSQLESVSLRYTKVTGAGVARLGPPLHVRRIEICDSGLNGLLAGLVAMKELRQVAVHDSYLSRSDVEALSSIPGLESIWFRDVILLEADAYESLASAKGLKALSFEDAGCDADDMAAIARLPELEFLEVTPISEAGLARLAPLPKLRGLTVDSQWGSDDWMQVSAEHPGCVVRNAWGGGYDYYLDGELVEENALPPLEWPSSPF